MRVGLAVLLVVGCSRPMPVESASPDPSSKPLPTVTAAPSPIATTAGQQACEPTVRCGVWSGCVWLERLDDTRYRAVGEGAKGEVFVRRRECWPADGGLNSCAVYCRGGDGGPPCVDGLHPELETCTGAAVPRPNSAKCLFGAGVCGSLM